MINTNCSQTIEQAAQQGNNPKKISKVCHCTVKILNSRIDVLVQTKIRLLLKEQSDQGLHCLLFHLHHLEVLHLALNFRLFTVKLVGVPKYRNFTVHFYMLLKTITEKAYNWFGMATFEPRHNRIFA